MIHLLTQMVLTPVLMFGVRMRAQFAVSTIRVSGWIRRSLRFVDDPSADADGTDSSADIWGPQARAVRSRYHPRERMDQERSQGLWMIHLLTQMVLTPVLARLPTSPQHTTRHPFHS